MSQPCATLGDLHFDLPPLILHPFNERIPPSTLLDNSKAALMLSGLIPSDGTAPEALQKRLLCGRYAYWGDIDTYGFHILDRLRVLFPDVQSLLMDRDTLLEH